MTADISDLRLRFLGSLVEQLGAQMYPSATSTIAELISNAWDADARNVWVSVPFASASGPGAQIVVIDDGVGMTHDEARDRYLIVGRKRRVELGKDETDGGRRLHGRKGIGKLAAFGTARVLECCSTKDGQTVRFRLDYDAIRALQAGADYAVEEARDTSPLVTPNGSPLDNGTRIVLSDLRLRRAINKTQFRQSMSRRFALDTTEMNIHLNGIRLERFEYPVQFRFPRDAVPDDVIEVNDGWATEEIGARPVRWWIGFTEKPLDDQSLQGISVLSRGKMVQRPFLFQRSQGVSGQLGQEYLVGEVQAEWLDEGEDVDTDRVQANRDQLQLEDTELDDFIAWGRRRLAWALRRRNELRRDNAVEKFGVAADTEELFEDFTTGEKRRYMGLARTVAGLDEMTPDGVFQAMKGVVEARDDVHVRQMWEEIDEEDPDVQSRIWDIVHRFGLIDARRNQTIIEARLRAISELKRFVAEGAAEVPTIHQHVRENTWLLDPRWHLLGDEVSAKDLGIDYEPEYDSGIRMDYLFALGSSDLTNADELVVVEIKRAKRADGTTFRASNQHVSKFLEYVTAARASARRSSNPPIVTGLMVVQDFTPAARELRETLEQPTSPRMLFRTWDRVIRDTERLHESWLNVEKRRGTEVDKDSGAA